MIYYSELCTIRAVCTDIFVTDFCLAAISMNPNTTFCTFNFVPLDFW